MINAGDSDWFVDADDDWTVWTEDGSLSAQWEYTVLVTETDTRFWPGRKELPGPDENTGKVDGMKKWLLAVLCAAALSGCSRYGAAEDITSPPEETEEGQAGTDSEAVEADADKPGNQAGAPEEAEPSEEAESLELSETEGEPERTPVQARGIYISAPAAGSGEIMEGILARIPGTEINAVVIDLKDDNGRVTCPMESPMVMETEASRPYVTDMAELVRRLKEGLWTLCDRPGGGVPGSLAGGEKAGVVPEAAGRHRVSGPFRPGLDQSLPGGGLGLSVEIGTQAAAMGFDEVQFDYIRFCTEKGVNDVVFDEADTRGRSKTDVITEFTAYASQQLAPRGVFVSADVFGAIIGSEVDAQSVGQIYVDMAKNLDYICPMIYPSHYGDGNFGIEHPDTEPYRTVLAALQGSARELAEAEQEGGDLRWSVPGSRISQLPIWITILNTGRRKFRPRSRPPMTRATRNGFCGLRLAATPGTGWRPERRQTRGRSLRMERPGGL